MAVVVIGGHSRDVGKTSVVAGLIAALPAYNWTAFKVTQFGHGRCSLNGKPCQCATADHAWALTEEKDRTGKSDSSRFLVAGAKHSYWVRTAQGKLAEAMPAIRRRLDEAENAILESNSILKFIRPEVYVSVLDPAVEDFKSSAREYFARADALIVHENNRHQNGGHQKGRNGSWRDVSLEGVTVPVFAIQQQAYVTREIVEFVDERLKAVLAGRR
jgi:hypothetical protein